MFAIHGHKSEYIKYKNHSNKRKLKLTQNLHPSGFELKHTCTWILIFFLIGNHTLIPRHKPEYIVIIQIKKKTINITILKFHCSEYISTVHAINVVVKNCFQTKVFKKSHNYQMAKERQMNAFQPSNEDRNIRVFMVWGLKNQDRSACHKTAHEKCPGKTVWDESFDLNPKPAQMELKVYLLYGQRNLTQTRYDNDKKKT